MNALRFGVTSDEIVFLHLESPLMSRQLARISVKSESLALQAGRLGARLPEETAETSKSDDKFCLPSL